MTKKINHNRFEIQTNKSKICINKIKVNMGIPSLNRQWNCWLLMQVPLFIYLFICFSCLSILFYFILFYFILFYLIYFSISI